VVSQNRGFCVWVSGEPASVVGSIARAVVREVGEHRRVEDCSAGPDWLAGADPRLRWGMVVDLAQGLTARGDAVVLATEPVDDAVRAEARRQLGRLVEVHVGGPRPGAAPLRAVDLAVAGDGARAGEAARAVLRHLAAVGYTEPLDDYSDDDEAAVAERLSAFGYL
jgi:hypothetical protein